MKEFYEKNIASPKRTKISANEAVCRGIQKDLDKGRFGRGAIANCYDSLLRAWVPIRVRESTFTYAVVASGFALPNGSSEKRKYNRLTHLNSIYNLGLNDEEIKTICEYNPTQNEQPGAD